MLRPPGGIHDLKSLTDEIIGKGMAVSVRLGDGSEGRSPRDLDGKGAQWQYRTRSNMRN